MTPSSPNGPPPTRGSSTDLAVSRIATPFWGERRPGRNWNSWSSPAVRSDPAQSLGPGATVRFVVPDLWPQICDRGLTQEKGPGAPIGAPPAAMGRLAAWFVLSALERLVSPRSRVVEELTRYRDRAIQDFCTQLRPAGHRKHQRVAARCPGRDELVAWPQNKQGRRALTRCHQFKTDGVPVSEPGSIEQRVELRQLLRACRQRCSDLTGAMVHSVVANVPRYRCVAHDISPPVGLLSAIELLFRQPTQRIIVRSALARSRGRQLY